MEFSTEIREAAALKQRIRRVLSVFRTVAAHMGGESRNSHESDLHLSGRIGAIGRVILAPVFFDGMDLESLVLDEMLWQAARPERYSISGPEVRLDPRSAELMSLVIHELATNAVKYGALSQSRARIRVAWDIALRSCCQMLRFSWEETGVMMAAVPLWRGFGCELVERLIARELKGEGRMTFLPDGLHCTIEVPLRDAPHRDE